MNRKKIKSDSLKQLTCIIAFREDSRQRRQNLSAVARYLTALGCAVVVSEFGARQCAPEALAASGLQCGYQFYPDVEPLFHHTRARNRAAYSARTALIALWDADVIIPYAQLAWSVAHLLERDCDYAFPYDGRFVDFTGHASTGYVSSAMRQIAFATHPPQVTEDVDGTITVVADGRKITGRTVTKTSVGGAVLFRRDVFMEGGMENEAFVSYSPEDQERDDRFRKLGFVSCRAEGLLYHLAHPRGVSSDDGHPFTESNWAEFRRIKGLSRSRLAAEVAGWGWIWPKVQTGECPRQEEQ